MGRDYRFSTQRVASGMGALAFPMVPITSVMSSPQMAGLMTSLRNQIGLWDADKSWSADSSFSDGRLGIICGGGGCNIPRCNFQFWNINAECSERSMETILSQMDRYMKHQVALQGLMNTAPAPVLRQTSGRAIFAAPAMPDLGNPWYSSIQKMFKGVGSGIPNWYEFNTLPDPKTQMTPQQREVMASTAHSRMQQFFPGTGWGKWVKDVLSHVAAARWCSNIRWYMATDANPGRVCPDESRWLGNAGRDYLKFSTANGEYPNPPPLQLSMPATMFSQMGVDDRYSWSSDPRLMKALFPRSRDGGGADRNPPLVGNTNKVPVSKEDYAPESFFFRSNMGARKNPLAYHEGNEVHITSPSLLGPHASYFKLWPDAWGGADYNGGFESQIDRWVAEGQTLEGSRKFVNGEWNGLPHPYFVLGWACSVAADLMNLDFLTATVQGMQGFATYYAQLPPERQTLKPSQLYQAARDQQAAIDSELNAQVSGALSAVGTAATAILLASSGTGPWGAIIGGIVAVVTLIAGLFIAYAYEIGTARIENPPCPAPPFIRMIPATGDTAVCDFNAERIPGAYQGVAIKAQVIGRLAEQGMRPGQWHSVLKSMEDEGDNPQIPGGDTEEGPNLLLIGGAAVAALAVVGVALAATRK